MRHPDSLFEASSRLLAKRTSRRSLIGALGRILTGGVVLPLLPVDRSAKAQATPSDDPQSCDYWRYCAIDGFLCSCCGGSASSCPPGTSPSLISWIGTCHNPNDGRDYMVSYNDCCGKASCGQCECYLNEREKPIYVPSRNNDLNWCMANENGNYHCTVSLIVAVAEQ
jgi:methylamine dehydrogenase light chain